MTAQFGRAAASVRPRYSIPTRKRYISREPVTQFVRSIQSGHEYESPIAVQLTLSQPATGNETVNLALYSGKAATPADFSLSTNQVISRPAR